MDVRTQQDELRGWTPPQLREVRVGDSTAGDVKSLNEAETTSYGFPYGPS